MGIDAAGDDAMERSGRPVLLVAYDGSAMSEAQLHLACRSANDIGAIVRVLYVVELSNHIPLDTPLPAPEKEQAELILDRAEGIGRRYGVAVQVEIDRARSVGEAIVAEAQEWRPRTIFMGLRDRNRAGVTLMLSGTVRHVLQNAGCPVQLGYLPAGLPEDSVREDAIPSR